MAAPSAVAAELSVAQVKVVPLSATKFGGTIERNTLSLRGLPVRGAYETVRQGPDGRRELLTARYPTVPPQLAPADVRVEAHAVASLVAAARGMADEPAVEGPPQLVYFMVLDHPVLAWETQLALTMSPEPSRPTVWISAATGRFLGEVDQVRQSQARMFVENPSATPELTEITLVDIDVDQAGEPLVGTRVQAFNCVEEEPEEVSPWWEEDECYPLQTVFSDEDGNFFVPAPDVVVVADNVQPQDPFSELSMYVHAERFLDAMREAGVEQFQCEQASMLANFRTFEPETLDTVPLNNAFYTNQCDAERGPTMVFGQGSEVDFGYDGDVVYHELGHGMVAMLSPSGLLARRLRSDASLVDAAGVNEALADYFSVMLTDDPHLADYVGRFWSSSGRPFIRDAENTKTCPNDTVGQVHNDGEPLMAALWATRKRLDDSGKRALDNAVISGLMRMAPDSSLEEAAARILEMAQLGGAQDQLSPDEQRLLRRSFEARGLDDCPRVVTDPKELRDGRTLYLRRDDASIHPFYPGPMQLRYEVPADGDDMVVRYTLRPRGSTDPVTATLLVKRGDEAIEFGYRVVAVDNPPTETEEGEPPSDPVRELVLVSGDWDMEMSGVEVTEDDYEVRLGGLEPGEVIHVMLVNAGSVEAVASDVRAHASTELPDDDDGATPMDEDPSDLPAVDEVSAEGGEAGCACTTVARPRDAGEGRAGEGWKLLGLLMLGAAARRRGG